MNILNFEFHWQRQGLAALMLLLLGLAAAVLTSQAAFAQNFVPRSEESFCQTDPVGQWREMRNACADYCGAGEICAQVITLGCDCGPGRCWTGDRCVRDEIDCPDIACDLDCPEGYQTDSLGCPVCGCRSQTSPRPTMLPLPSPSSSPWPQPKPCWDLDGDGRVGLSDLMIVFRGWGRGENNFNRLWQVLVHWGQKCLI